MLLSAMERRQTFILILQRPQLFNKVFSYCVPSLPMDLTLFYAAAITTIAELIEEIILIKLLPDWETNVKGIYRYW